MCRLRQRADTVIELQIFDNLNAVNQSVVVQEGALLRKLIPAVVKHGLGELHVLRVDSPIPEEGDLCDLVQKCCEVCQFSSWK